MASLVCTTRAWNTISCVARCARKNDRRRLTVELSTACAGQRAALKLRGRFFSSNLVVERESVMATVRDLLAAKKVQLMAVGPEASVLDAALLMNEHKVGSLLVMDGGRLRGIITERDILQRVVGPCLHPAQTPVHGVMTTEVVCCQPHTPLDEARGVLKNRRIRHLPVV